MDEYEVDLIVGRSMASWDRSATTERPWRAMRGWARTTIRGGAARSPRP